MVRPILCCGNAGGARWWPARLSAHKGVDAMATRREFLTNLFGAGTVGLIAACGGAASQTPVSPTSAAAKPAATTAAAPAPAATAAAPAQTAPAQAAIKPAAAGGTITFVLENDVIDFDPLLSRAFVD